MSDDAGLIRAMKDANLGAAGAARRPPPPPPSAPTGGSEGEGGLSNIDERELGRQLAAILKAGKYHPVVIVGSKGSGKTTFLASLLARVYANPNEASVDFRLAEKCLFPAHHPRRIEIENQTLEFYDGTVVNFAGWELVEATRFTHPFYVPIDVVPTNPALAPIRLAFLESQGEIHDPEVKQRKIGSIERQFLTRKELPEVIASVLASFDRSITFIYVAPCVTSGELARKEADLALSQGLEKILAIRVPNGLARSDRHLLLLSMWDEHTGSVSAPAFRRPSKAETDSVLMSRFPNAWKKFASLRSESPEAQYFQMHYSVGPVAVGQVARVASDARPLLNRFPRTVLNWLYHGATGNVLFPDVVPPPPPRWNFLDWIGRVIRFGTFRV